MLLGSVLAFAIATTRVVLPYDEQFVGLTPARAGRGQRAAAAVPDPRSRDAGRRDGRRSACSTPACRGSASRRGRHWAQVAIVASRRRRLRQLLPVPRLRLLRSVPRLRDRDPVPAPGPGRARPPRPAAPICRRRCWSRIGAWRLGLWGQLGLVIQGVGFIGAGLIISAIGVTHVFVHEDLEFLRHDARRRWPRSSREPRAARRPRPRHARRHAARQRPGRSC